MTLSFKLNNGCITFGTETLNHSGFFFKSEQTRRNETGGEEEGGEVEWERAGWDRGFGRWRPP